MEFKYLVCAALIEELIEFFNISDAKPVPIGDRLDYLTVKYAGKEILVATYCSNIMGMVYNSAKLMEIILEVKPKYTIFIGICAGFKSRGYPIGSVLIPQRAFSYESGKYDEKGFSTDSLAYYTSQLLRREAAFLHTTIKENINFKVVTDEDICSGAAVINNPEKVEEIMKNTPRKMAGLDMEAYSLAVINEIFKENETLVIKAISDYAVKKEESEVSSKVEGEASSKVEGEVSSDRELAKKNSAFFALELIKHLEDRGIGEEKSDYKLDILPVGTGGGKTFPVKIQFTVKNDTPNIISIFSESFIFSHPFKLHSRPGKYIKPFFKVDEVTFGVETKDVYLDTYILQPNETIKSCWIPLHVDTNLEELNKAIQEKKVGTWNYKTSIMKRGSIFNKNVLAV